MIAAESALPEIDEGRLDDAFYRRVPDQYRVLLSELEAHIKKAASDAAETVVKAFDGARQQVPADLYSDWCRARFGWTEREVELFRLKDKELKVAAAAAEAERTRLVLELNQQRIPQETIATTLDMTRDEVRLVLRESPNTNTDCRTKADEAVVVEVLQRLDAGETQKAIAKSLGISQGRVSQIKQGKTGNESKRAPRNRIPDEKRQAILEDFAGGLPRREISQKHNVSINTVNRVINAAGAAAPEKPAEQTKQDGRTVVHSNSYHSPSLAELKAPNSPAAALMESHRIMLMSATTKALKDIATLETRLLKLQQRIQEEYAQYHGSMIARWAAYERCWEDELVDQLGAQSLTDISPILQEKLKKAAKRVGECFATFEMLKTVDYVIED